MGPFTILVSCWIRMSQFIQCTAQGNNWEYRLGLGTIVKVDGQAEGRPVTTDCFRFRIPQDLGLPPHCRLKRMCATG